MLMAAAPRWEAMLQHLHSAQPRSIPFGKVSNLLSPFWCHTSVLKGLVKMSDAVAYNLRDEESDKQGGPRESSPDYVGARLPRRMHEFQCIDLLGVVWVVRLLLISPIHLCTQYGHRQGQHGICGQARHGLVLTMLNGMRLGARQP